MLRRAPERAVQPWEHRLLPSHPNAEKIRKEGGKNHLVKVSSKLGASPLLRIQF